MTARPTSNALAANAAPGNARLVEVGLLVGFLALTIAVVAAATSPATGYELSIYAATPAAFWIGAGVALAVSLALALALGPGLARGVALLLGGETLVALVGLPVVRGYAFYGTHDALTHLGWVKDLSGAVLSPFELFYPGIHTGAVFVGRTAGVGPERSLLLVVVAAFVVFLTFVPLVVRAVAGHPSALVVGAFAGFLLLPINAISTHAHAHPFSQTTLLSAMVLFLLVRYVRGPTDRVPSLRPTAFGAMLALAGAGIVLFHPQQAVNVVVVMLTVSLLQFVVRRRWPDHAIAGHRPLYGQTAFLAAVFAAWTFRFDLPYAAVESVLATAEGYLLGQPPAAASAVQSQATSLTAIGAALPAMFLKLFLVSAVFWVLAGWLALEVVLGRLEAGPGRAALVAYLIAGVVAMLPLFAVYLFGSISEQYFRHWGFLMLLVTVLGAVAIVRLLARPGGPARFRLTPRARGSARPRAVAGVAVAFALMLVLSLATVFPSPYVHQATPHVTDRQLSGYGTVFERHDPDVPLRSVRQGPWRYSDAVHGVGDSREYRLAVPDHRLSSLGALYDDPQYLVTSQLDRERELRAYRGLRYSQEGFDSLDGQPSTSRVFSNGDVELYWIAG